ncbi:hypothetical protein [Alteromonas lipolytica]|uniref:DUF4386 domain-containing protein n=1 Tax=Alteromonas lipolytica TaxID=1856405 RepID=A0A1E8FHP2_9ALTE|nr:hypothetical protein [Alteromonas lipolytica]OFI35455.1 hypothetical protein BFC17_11860 [Alteromonas lipolytica]GGF76424.1 hypothetical protein GCM10011338_30730 [Alteromonas lipolytica]
MDSRFRLGGIAALVCAMCFVIGFTMILFVMPDIHVNGDERLQAILAQPRLIQSWYLIIFVLFGIALLLLNRSLYLPPAEASGQLQLIGALIGYVWAAYVFAIGFISVLTIEYLLHQSATQIEQAWPAIFAIQTGLGDGVEWIGGIWMVMINLSLYYHRVVSRQLSVYGGIVGITGLFTLYPPFAAVGGVFGVLQILWFCWLGSLLLRQKVRLLPT